MSKENEVQEKLNSILVVAPRSMLEAVSTCQHSTTSDVTHFIDLTGKDGTTATSAGHQTAKS